MISKEILNQIRSLEITTKRHMKGMLIGDSRSAQKGTGLEFHQIREYQQGDDVRFIDWKSSARMHKMLVKEYIEERSRTIMLLVDCSASSWFGSLHERKFDRMAQIASVLALVAQASRDSVGLILFSDVVELFIPPSRGVKHVHHIMQKLFECTVSDKGTDIGVAFDRLMAMKQKNMAVFVVSDFFEQQFEKKLRAVAHVHEIVAIRCLDAYESALPRVGVVMMQDSETSLLGRVATRSEFVQDALLQFQRKQRQLLTQSGVDCLDLTTDQPFMIPLMQFFRQRMRY